MNRCFALSSGAVVLLTILIALQSDPLSAGELSPGFSWHVRVSFSGAERQNSTAWLVCARTKDAFVLLPYAIDMPDHVPPAMNFSRGHALAIDLTDAAWIGDSGSKPITGKAQPGLVAPDGHYSFANFVYVIRTCWLDATGQDITPLQALQLVFGVSDSTDSIRPEGFHLAARSADIYGVLQHSDHTADNEVLLDRIPYLEAGRSIKIDWNDHSSFGRVPRRVEIRSPDRLTFMAEFFDWKPVPAIVKDRESLTSHAQQLADETLISRARRVLETYRSHVLKGTSRDESRQCLKSFQKYSIQDLHGYGREFCFAFNEARLGCLARTGDLDQVYSGIVLEQLPYLLQAPGRSTTCGYIACWCQLFTDLKSTERAHDLLNDSAVLTASHWGPAAGPSVREISLGKSGLQNPVDLEWCHLLADGIDQKQALTANQIQSRILGKSFAPGDGRLLVACYLDRHFFASESAIKTGPIAPSPKIQKDQSPSAVPSPRYSRHYDHMRTSLSDALGNSRAVSRKSCLAALERGLLPLKEHATARTDDELDQLASSFSETVQLWKLSDSNAEKLVSFSTTIEWVIQDFLCAEVRSPAYMSRRSEQLRWQISQVDQLDKAISQLSPRVTDPTLDYSKAITALRRDLQQEVANPMAPFFRWPLRDDSWRRYQSEVTASRESAMLQLKRQLREIDSEFDRQMQEALSNSTIRDHLGLKRQQKKYLEVMTCIGTVSASVVRDYCMENFPDIDSDQFAPLRIKQVGISYAVGSRIRVRLLPRLTPD